MDNEDFIGLSEYSYSNFAKRKNFLLKNLMMMSSNIKNLFDNFEDFLEDSCENFKKSLDIVNKNGKNIKIVKDVDEKKDFEDYQLYTKKLDSQYISVKGHIQSGKTNFIIFMSSLFMHIGYSVVIMLRNIDADREQIYKRINDFYKNNDYDDSFLVKKIKNDIKIETKNTYLFFGISNDVNINNINKAVELLDRPYILFIDEVDYVDSKSGKKDFSLQILKDRSYCVFGISATIMDVLVNENVTSKNMVILKPHVNYKGFSNNMINMCEISKKIKYSSKKNIDLIKNNKFIEEFIKNYTLKDIYQKYSHPNICLFNLTRCINPCLNLQKYISAEYPQITTIVYNGQGLILRKGEFFKDDINTISDALQYLKDNGGCDRHPHILIFSGDLAGRGISFVSNDYKWHLTDELLIVSNKSDEPELQQKIRLCGCYEDDIQLTLYSTQKILKDLKKACIRQEEYLVACINESRDILSKEIIENYPISNSKFTKRSMLKTNEKPKLNKVENGGWSEKLYEYDENESKEIEEMYHLYGFRNKAIEYVEYKTRSFNEEENSKTIEFIEKKLSKGNTNESIFLSLLDISKIYSKEEIIELLYKSKYKQPKSMFSAMITPDNKYEKGKRYGHHYFDKVGDNSWKIRECLIMCWKK